MPPYTYTLAAAAAVLAATAMASWHRNGVEVPARPVQAAAGCHAGPAGTNAQAMYLPALFGDEERAAPIEPLPPQF